MTESKVDEAARMDGWQPLSESTPYHHSSYVWLLLSNGRVVPGLYRKGMFWGKEVEGWWTPEHIGYFGRPSHSMWIDGMIVGWKRYCDLPAPDTAREVESLQARVRELEDLPRLIELEREGTCDDAADEAWNRALSRAATMVRATLKETSHAE